ncbi:MAG: DM13 domain-containing protein [Parvularcula sp.]|jgi:hypothetical protein|nr:DM13 domain-containing protein [Parvularcula sp.]
MRELSKMIAAAAFVGLAAIASATITPSAAALTIGAENGSMLASGAFASGEGHSTKGTAAIIREGGKTYLELTGFETDRGPDLQVWLTTSKVMTGADGKSTEKLVLGRLRSAKADTQRYEIPEGTDTAAFESVVIWCRAFGVLFGAAQLA